MADQGLKTALVAGATAHAGLPGVRIIPSGEMQRHAT
jgi:hypothetical protein